MDTSDAQDERAEFHEAVNMTKKQLSEWLGTEESQAVGQKKDGDESTGHHYGRRILALLDTPAKDLTDEDRADMRKVHGYVARHLAQRPDGDVEHTPWRYSLMNWGHDPLR